VRARAARRIVRWVSGFIEMSYEANEVGWPEMSWVAGQVGRFMQMALFPVARLLDKEAMVDQMVVECWWG